MTYDQKAFDDARWDRDIACIRLTGMLWALVQLGTLDDLRERFPHTYADLGKYLADYDISMELISQLSGNTPSYIIDGLKEQSGDEHGLATVRG